MCQYSYDCKNYPDKCYRCSDCKLYNSKTGKKPKIVEHHQDMNKAMADNSWESLEQEVADNLNLIPTIREARRSRASGALWFEKGDVIDSILHPECKERAAEKSFSIKREWLEKAVDECKYSEKVMCLPFRFKGDTQVYTVMRNEDIMELVTMMKTYIQDNERMRAEIEILRKKLNERKDNQ